MLEMQHNSSVKPIDDTVMRTNSKTVLEIVFRLVVTGIILIAGIGLPFIAWGGGGRFVNVIWGMVYGAGWLLAELLSADIRSIVAVVWAAIVWPLAVSAGVYFVTGIVLHASSKSQVVVAIAVLMSLCCIIGVDRAFTAPLNRLPTFSHYFFIVY